MNRQDDLSTIKTLVTGLIVSGVVLTGLTATGCDTRVSEQLAALTSGSGQVAQDKDAAKSEAAAKLAANHNETFRVGAEA